MKETIKEEIVNKETDGTTIVYIFLILIFMFIIYMSGINLGYVILIGIIVFISLNVVRSI